MKQAILSVATVFLVLAAGLVLRTDTACDPGGEVVFVQTSRFQIVSITAEGPLGEVIPRTTDGGDLNYGESVSFHAKDTGWSMNLTVSLIHGQRGSSASITLDRPPEGKRWFVTLETEGEHPFLRSSTVWPLD